MSITTQGYKIGKQPIAQSFYIDEPSGIFCTKVDLYLKVADENAPIQIQIRPMINGFPSSSRILSGSVKSLPGSHFTGGANVSTDATVTATFELDEPVFLKGLTDFALVVIADSKDYEIFIAEINEFTVGSTEKRVNKQPILGSLFYSQNGSTFTPAQNQDLTFRIHKARFKNIPSTTAILRNAALPKQLLRPNPIKTIKNSTTVQVNHPNHGMQVGQRIVLEGVDAGGVGGILSSTLNKRYNIVAMDHTGYTFTADSAADSDAIGGGSLVKSTKNILYSTIFPNISALTTEANAIFPSIKTISGKSYAGDETAFQKETTFKTLKLLENTSLPSLSMIAHDSAETSELGSGIKSLDMQLSMPQIDSNIAPVIDLQRSSVILSSNIIDRQYDSSTSSPGSFNAPLNFTAETSARGGSSAAKHLTAPVTLVEEAVGLKILIGASVPTAADFEIYVRTADNEALKTQGFVLVPPENTLVKDDTGLIFNDYQFLHGGLGGDVPPFKKFQVKIVMRSIDQSKPTIFSDLRIIALSS